MAYKLAGIDVETRIGDFKIVIEEVSLTIDDKSEVQYQRGVPNGRTRGAASASGEITVDSASFSVITDAAKAAGSFQDIEPLDISFLGDTGDSRVDVKAYGCALKVTDLITAQTNSESKVMHKIAYDVTSPDFVTINGAPYVNPKAQQELR